MWRGGKSLASSGYVLVRVGVGHHLADVRGYAYEHRLVMENTLRRKLKKGEIVHHKNGNKVDNRPDNLEVCKSISHHRMEHRTHERGLRHPDEKNPIAHCACGCGKTFLKFDGSNRPRKYISGHNLQNGK